MIKQSYAWVVAGAWDRSPPTWRIGRTRAQAIQGFIRIADGAKISDDKVARRKAWSKWRKKGYLARKIAITYADFIPEDHGYESER